MAVVSRTQLWRFMSEPRWSEAQQATAEEILDGVESDLAGALYGTVITPVPRTELVPFGASGRLLTTLPVFRPLTVGEAVVTTADGWEPDGWTPEREPALTLPAGYLFDFTSRTLSLSAPPLPSRVAWADRWGSGPADAGLGGVMMRYLAGWGPAPALVDLIKRKAAARMGNRHADTMAVTGVTAQAAQSTPMEENITDADVKSLGRYRALGWG
jgi:hypothetical protein